MIKYDKLSVLVPCFNEELVITETNSRIVNVMIKHNINYEIIYINDGSIDNTFNILTDLSKNNKHIKVLNFSRNFGHQNAVSAGVHNCSGDLAVIIDADLQDPPEVIPEMIELLIKEKCNVVYAQRIKRKEKSIFKKVTASIFYKLINFLSDIKFPVDTGDFRLIDKKVIEAYKSFPERNKYIRGLISWMGFKQVPFKYVREERFAGETKYTFTKMMRLALTGIFGFSKKPLKLALNLGLICIFLGVFFTFWILYISFFESDKVIQGWTSTIITIVFLGGIQLLTIGVLGEYIGSIFDETKNRPEYIIESKLNMDNND
jgi:glycosyltransferase involved in cell wall biosynthesis